MYEFLEAPKAGVIIRPTLQKRKLSHRGLGSGSHHSKPGKLALVHQVLPSLFRSHKGWQGPCNPGRKGDSEHPGKIRRQPWGQSLPLVNHHAGHLCLSLFAGQYFMVGVTKGSTGSLDHRKPGPPRPALNGGSFCWIWEARALSGMPSTHCPVAPGALLPPTQPPVLTSLRGPLIKETSDFAHSIDQNKLLGTNLWASLQPMTWWIVRYWSVNWIVRLDYWFVYSYLS